MMVGEIVYIKGKNKITKCKITGHLERNLYWVELLENFQDLDGNLFPAGHKWPVSSKYFVKKEENVRSL